MAKLTSNTTVRHPDTGESVFLRDGLNLDDVPEWALPMIGRHLVDDASAHVGADAEAGAAAASETRDDDNAVVTRGWMRQFMAELIAQERVDYQDDDPQDDDQDQGSDPMPPTSGKGSGAEAWAKWADDHGIAYPDGASRDEIIAAVEAANAS